jgi:hypothetical protein
MIRQLREKQNREVGEYNNAINRQVINKMHSQVALWESDRPSNQILDTETATNYEETVKYLGDLLTNKLSTIQTIDLNNSGSEKQYKEIIDNSDFINKYNLIVKPLSSGSVLKKTKSAIENLVQPLQPLIEQITIAFNKLVNNERAVGLARINPILSSYSLFDYIKQQYKNNVFVPVSASNLQSYYSTYFIPKLGPSVVNRLKEALDEYNRQPNLRKEAMASQVGRLSPEELKGILKLQGISEFPLSASIGIQSKPEMTETPAQTEPTASQPKSTPKFTPRLRQYYSNMATQGQVQAAINELGAKLNAALNPKKGKQTDVELVQALNDEIKLAQEVLTEKKMGRKPRGNPPKYLDEGL